jgi:acetyl-CoA carboxylase, biotin carboxylase subunit
MKILIANRNEIAVRILRACRELGIPSVAVYTDADQTAVHTRLADEAVRLGPSQAYLDAQAILSAARQAGADAIHPGYGFLSENAEFAGAVEEAGLTFIGPRSQTIAMLGDKLSSRQAARQAGLPVLPGSRGPLPDNMPCRATLKYAFPVLVKAVAGGGGRGIRLAASAQELPEVVAAARKEAKAVFGNDAVYLESLVQEARHIEVQVLGDGEGRVICLGERECSIQRRRQKLIEESPAPGISEKLRRELYEAAVRLVSRLRYRSLGTVEFLIDSKGRFYFIEVNPRIQVEHPVTEMVTGIDLVKEQLLLAMGGPLRLRQEDVRVNGAAVEARVLAEDCAHGFLPSSGEIAYLKEPGGPGIRVDSALYQGLKVGVEYDSLLAKVIAHGEDRQAAIRRLQGALDEFQIGGLATDLDFLKQIIESPSFQRGQVTTTYLDSLIPRLPERREEFQRILALAAALYTHQNRAGMAPALQSQRPASQWMVTAWQEQMAGGG